MMTREPPSLGPKSADEALTEEFLQLCSVVAALRHPRTGCPWDLAQDHLSLRKHMIEEAGEAADAMGKDSPEDLCEELGDVLLQVVLNAQIASERRSFTMTEVVAGLRQKLIRRHPHVFGNEEERQRRSFEEIGAKWLEIKAQEKAARKIHLHRTTPE